MKLTIKNPCILRYRDSYKPCYHSALLHPHRCNLIRCLTAPRDITVAPGKAYTAKAFSPQLTKGIRRFMRYCFAPNNSSLKRPKTVTGFRSNALIYDNIFYRKNSCLSSLNIIFFKPVSCESYSLTVACFA